MSIRKNTPWISVSVLIVQNMNILVNIGAVKTNRKRTIVHMNMIMIIVLGSNTPFFLLISGASFATCFQQQTKRNLLS